MPIAWQWPAPKLLFLVGTRQEVGEREWTGDSWKGRDAETVPGILFTGQEGGFGQAPLLVGVLLVLMAVVLASLIYR